MSKAHTKEWARHALSIVKTVSDVVAKTAGNAVPGLSVGLAALSTILEKIEVCSLLV